MKHTLKFFGWLLFIGLCTYQGNAQFNTVVDDAVRLAQPSTLVGTRSAGMGNAFIGVADDYSALYWNPAGLGQLRQSEFALGLNTIQFKNNAGFLSSSVTSNNSSTVLNSLGLALPFAVERGSLVVAIGYNRLTDYSYSRSFDAYNPGSSIQPSLYNSSADMDLAWNLGLEDTTSLIPIRNNVRQVGSSTQTGGLNQWALGGSVEVAPNFWLGASFNLLTGSYNFDRTLVETDPNNLHQDPIGGKNGNHYGFKELDMNESLQQDLAGWDAKFGLFYTLLDKARFGLTIKTPSMMTVGQDYSLSGDAFFTDGNEHATILYAHDKYNVTTPWVFGLGASYMPLTFLTIAADVELTDYSQTSFDVSNMTSDQNAGFRSLNTDMMNNLKATNNFRLGAELNVPNTGLFIRAGFGEYFSPYKGDPTSYNTTTYSGGLGYLFDNTILLNVSYTFSKFKNFQYNYSPNTSDPYYTDVNPTYYTTFDDVTISRIFFSLAYKF